MDVVFVCAVTDNVHINSNELAQETFEHIVTIFEFLFDRESALVAQCTCIIGNLCVCVCARVAFHVNAIELLLVIAVKNAEHMHTVLKRSGQCEQPNKCVSLVSVSAMDILCLINCHFSSLRLINMEISNCMSCSRCTRTCTQTNHLIRDEPTTNT